MTIEIKKNADELVLEITGRLDTITAPALDKTINENLGEIKSLILDFKNLEYISSAGLRVLLSTQKKLQQKLFTLVWVKFQKLMNNTKHISLNVSKKTMKNILEWILN